MPTKVLVLFLGCLAACAGPDYGFDLATSRACSVMQCSTCAKTDFVADGSYNYQDCRYIGWSADLPSPAGSICSGMFGACRSSADGHLYTNEYGPSGVATSSTMTSKYVSCGGNGGEFQVWGIEHADSGGCPHDLYFVLRCTGGAAAASSYSCERYIEVVSDYTCAGMTLRRGDYYLQSLTLTRFGPPPC